MTHDSVLEQLDDWAGGELPAAERAELDLHLAGCAECRAEAEALRTLLNELAAVPAEIAPDRDLWAGIANRLEPRAAVGLEVVASRRALRFPRWAMQAAAAVVLMAGSSAVTYRLAGPERIQEVASDLVEPVVPRKAPVTALVAFQPAEEEYRTAIGELQTVLESHRSRLAPETVRTLEANLRIIDEAIRQSRDALARDPNSAELARMLGDAYDQKLDVLQQAVAL